MFFAFNQPLLGVNNRGLEIRNLLKAIFENAHTGTEVYGTVYLWKDIGFTTEIDTIIQNRNLNATLFVGYPTLDQESRIGDEDTPPFDSDGVIRDFFNRYGGFYNNDPDGMMNHTKMILFEKVDFTSLKKNKLVQYIHDPVYDKHFTDETPAVYISTGNITENGKHNTAVLLPVTSEVYNQIRAYLAKIKSAFEGVEVDHEYTTYSWFDRFKIYLFPRFGRTRNTDTLFRVLKNVKHYSQKSKDPCFVGIVSARWRDGRRDLAKAASTLYHHGATVETVTRSQQDKDADGNPELGDEIFNILKCRLVERVITPVPGDGLRLGNISSLFYQADGVNIHTKMLILDGPYKEGNGYTHQKNVWIGSPNLTVPAINDHWESMVKIANHPAFKYFHENFMYLRNEAAVRDEMYETIHRLGL